LASSARIGKAVRLGQQLGLDEMGLGAVGVVLQHGLHQLQRLVHLSGLGRGIDLIHRGILCHGGHGPPRRHGQRGRQGHLAQG
jgi:hypothetical protein